MYKQNKKVNINIDDKRLEVESGLTILQAAEQNNIYLPTLCAHKDLSPFGGCRMCIVEVKGIRGFPTACTTTVEEGMAIKTHTAQLQTERSSLLKSLKEGLIVCGL